MAKYFWIVVAAVVLPDWLIGFILVGIPVLMLFGLIMGGGLYGLIRGFKAIWND